MTLSLPHIIKDPQIQANFDRIAQAIVTSTAETKGVATLSFVANNDATTTVAHGLPGVPRNVQATPREAGSASLSAVACTDRDATIIRISARTRDGLNTTMTVDVDWRAEL